MKLQAGFPFFCIAVSIYATRSAWLSATCGKISLSFSNMLPLNTKGFKIYH